MRQRRAPIDFRRRRDFSNSLIRMPLTKCHTPQRHQGDRVSWKQFTQSSRQLLGFRELASQQSKMSQLSQRRIVATI